MKLEGFEGQNEWFSMSVGGGCRQWSVIVRVYPKKLMSQSPFNLGLSLPLILFFSYHGFLCCLVCYHEMGLCSIVLLSIGVGCFNFSLYLVGI